MVVDYKHLDLYFHMTNHYRKIRKARSLINCNSPRNKGCNGHSKCQTCRLPSNSSSRTCTTAKMVYQSVVHSKDGIKCNTGSVYCTTQHNTCCPPVPHSCGSSPRMPCQRSTEIGPIIRSCRTLGPATQCRKVMDNKRTSTSSIRSTSQNRSKVDVLKMVKEQSDENLEQKEEQSVINGRSSVNVSEHEYVHFLLRITEDILRGNLYSDKQMQEVFDSHVRANRGRLDPAKMQEQIDYLKLELGSPKFSDSASCVQWDEKNKELIVVQCPRKQDLQVKCHCLNPNCVHLTHCATQLIRREDAKDMETEMVGVISKDDVGEEKFAMHEVVENFDLSSMEKKIEPAKREEQEEKVALDHELSKDDNSSSGNSLTFRKLDRDAYQSTNSLQKKALNQMQAGDDYVVVDGPIYLPKTIIDNEQVAIFVGDDHVKHKHHVKLPKDVEEPVQSSVKKDDLISVSRFIIDEMAPADLFINEPSTKTSLSSLMKTMLFNEDEQEMKSEDVPKSDEKSSVTQEKPAESEAESLVKNEVCDSCICDDEELEAVDSCKCDDESGVVEPDPNKIFNYEIINVEGKAPDEELQEVSPCKAGPCPAVQIVDSAPLESRHSYYAHVKDMPDCNCAVNTGQRTGLKILFNEDGDADEEYVMLEGPVYVPKLIADTKTIPILIDSLSSDGMQRSDAKKQSEAISKVNLYKPREAKDADNLQSVSGELVPQKDKKSIVGDVEEIRSISYETGDVKHDEDAEKFVEKLQKFEEECKIATVEQKKLDAELAKYSFTFNRSDFGDTNYHFLLKDMATSMTDFRERMDALQASMEPSLALTQELMSVKEEEVLSEELLKGSISASLETKNFHIEEEEDDDDEPAMIVPSIGSIPSEDLGSDPNEEMVTHAPNAVNFKPKSGHDFVDLATVFSTRDVPSNKEYTLSDEDDDDDDEEIHGPSRLALTVDLEAEPGLKEENDVKPVEESVKVPVPLVIEQFPPDFSDLKSDTRNDSLANENEVHSYNYSIPKARPFDDYLQAVQPSDLGQSSKKLSSLSIDKQSEFGLQSMTDSTADHAHRPSIIKGNAMRGETQSNGSRPKSTSFQVESIPIPYIKPKEKQSSTEMEAHIRERFDSLTIEKEISRRNMLESKFKDMPVVKKESSSELLAPPSASYAEDDSNLEQLGSAKSLLAKLDKIPSTTSRNDAEAIDQVRTTLKKFRTISIGHGGKVDMSSFEAETLANNPMEKNEAPPVDEKLVKSEPLDQIDSAEQRENCLRCCSKKKK